jgi:FAD:protein FMN transferase
MSPASTDLAGEVAGEVRRHRCTVFTAECTFVVPADVTVDLAPMERTLRDYEQRFSRFIDDNELARLHRDTGSWVDVSAELEQLLAHALHVAVQSSGLVNIAVSTAVRGAGYIAPWPAKWSPPAATPEPVAPLTEVLQVGRRRARLAPGARLDLGALAKGCWADELVDRLGSNAAVSLGGDVSARGPGPRGDGWPIGLPHGRTVLLRDGGVATSGTSRRRSGQSHHIIDPRTGAPCTSSVTQATVLARNAATAEWVATAVVVSGETHTWLTRDDVEMVWREPQEAP